MSLTPSQLNNYRRHKILGVSICNDSCFVFCSKCNERQQVAFGHHVKDMTLLTIIHCLVVLEWQSAPVFLCVNCRPPFEKRSYEQRLNAIHRNYPKPVNEEINE